MSKINGIKRSLWGKRRTRRIIIEKRLAVRKARPIIANTAPVVVQTRSQFHRPRPSSSHLGVAKPTAAKTMAMPATTALATSRRDSFKLISSIYKNGSDVAWNGCLMYLCVAMKLEKFTHGQSIGTKNDVERYWFYIKCPLHFNLSLVSLSLASRCFS